MKRLFILLLWSLSVSSFCAAAANTGKMPGIIEAGFDAYAKTNSAAALEAWLKGSPLENDTTMRANFATGIGKIESSFGKYIGWELIKLVELGDSAYVAYVVAKYEKGPLWIVFYCYKANDQWIIPNFDLNTNPSKVFPASMLGGS